MWNRFESSEDSVQSSLESTGKPHTHTLKQGRGSETGSGIRAWIANELSYRIRFRIRIQVFKLHFILKKVLFYIFIVFIVKCWIRIRIKLARIRNTALKKKYIIFFLYTLVIFFHNCYWQFWPQKQTYHWPVIKFFMSQVQADSRHRFRYAVQGLHHL